MFGRFFLAADFVYRNPGQFHPKSELMAFGAENTARIQFRDRVPGWENLVIRY
jgi:hypothetical protein